MKMTKAELFNKIVGMGISPVKVLKAIQSCNSEGEMQLEVTKTTIEAEPMIISPTLFDESYDVVYLPLYDTLHEVSNQHKLFVKPIGQDKTYEETNMVLQGSLPIPTLFVVRGFRIQTKLNSTILEYLIMRFTVLHKIYAEMPLSHLPYRYRSNRVIIPPGGTFGIDIYSNAPVKIKEKLVFFITGWQIRAVQ